MHVGSNDQHQIQLSSDITSRTPLYWSCPTESQHLASADPLDNLGRIMRRVLVYADTFKASATYQIRIASPLQDAGIDVVHIDDLKSSELTNIVRSEVDTVFVHRGMRKRCEVYAVLREAARNFGKSLIYDVDDLLIQVSRTHPHYRVYQSRDLRALKTLVDADLVVASTPALSPIIHESGKS